MDAFTSSPPSSSSQVSEEDLIDQVKEELAQAYAEEFFEVMWYSHTRQSVIQVLAPAAFRFLCIWIHVDQRVRD